MIMTGHRLVSSNPGGKSILTARRPLGPSMYRIFSIADGGSFAPEGKAPAVTVSNDSDSARKNRDDLFVFVSSKALEEALGALYQFFNGACCFF